MKLRIAIFSLQIFVFAFVMSEKQDGDAKINKEKVNRNGVKYMKNNKIKIKQQNEADISTKNKIHQYYSSSSPISEVTNK